MRSHGHTQRSIFEFLPLIQEEPDDGGPVTESYLSVESAYEGDDSSARDYWLYDWVHGSFDLVRAPADDVQSYVQILTHGPMIIVRMGFPFPETNSLLDVMLPIFRESFEIKKKDVFAMERMDVGRADRRAERQENLLNTCKRAFSGSTSDLTETWLYDWTGEQPRLVRAGT